MSDKAKPGFRTHEGDFQIVKVDGYTYRWRGEALAAGDTVLLPENWLSRIKNGHGPFPGVVTDLGSDYQAGPLSSVLRVLHRGAPVP